MCEMKFNGRCRSTLYFMQRCGVLRSFFCGLGSIYRANRRERLNKIRQEEETRRGLGVGI